MQNPPMASPIHTLLPPWAHRWLDLIVPATEIALIVLGAWLLRTLLRLLIRRLGARYTFPSELAILARRGTGFAIYTAALLLILDRLGVSGTVLWTAFTGFAAVAAVAFFAAWSVLSNIFCALLIFTTRPFRLHDHIELLENGDKPGLKGQVIDINLIYTTLRERHDGDAETVLQIPNSLFFQRSTRRWRDQPVPAGLG
ncbi:mechanosensitive ion channel [Xanthomonas sp. AmX2]|uniref:mechanosensitive ion channel family protein n=1 Tax=Xanthomonas sp. TaxID=29446 RepID=UPI0019826023|nr:mechanosensitive ion channel family protein [Xanthomonas sp.]MBN6151975.1 mechanosensitive ion channel [Xanthomonas sp.]